MRAFTSAGERVAVDTEPAWAGRLVDAAVGAPRDDPRVNGDAQVDGDPTVRIRVEARRTEFPRTGLRPVTRGAYSDGRRTLFLDAGGSGFDLLLVMGDDQLSVIARYRPPARTRLANVVAASRFRLLAGQVLVHYPVLWRAGLRGRVPLHASVARTGAGTPLLAGPGGVGKSTVLVGLLADGAAATADNLCCADRSLCFGLVEPLRTDAVPGGPVLSAAGAGARTSHGRTEWPLTARVPVLAPDRIVVLERGVHTEISPIPAAEAARTLVAGTYAAGELRRYWAFAATLALATGRGPAHPPVAEVAADHAGRLPCVRVRVGDGDSVTAAQLCGENP